MAKQELKFLPATVEDVSDEWLAAALKVPRLRIKSIKQIGEDYGFASKLIKIRFEFEGAIQTVIAKLWSTDTVGDKEVSFYQLFNQMGSRIPHCFFAQSDSETKRGILLLEEISGATQGDVLKHANLYQAKSLAANLAHLHAAFLKVEKKNEPVWISKWSDKIRSAGWIQARRKTFLERFPTHLSEISMNLLHSLEDAYPLAVRNLSRYPTTLLHGDFHLDNILFKNDNEAVLLDWSDPIWGPAELNLATLLFEMGHLDDFNLILDSYLMAFNQLAPKTASKSAAMEPLHWALICNFTKATCGTALWNPTLPRAKKVINHSIQTIDKAINFWDRNHQSFESLFKKK